MRNRMCAIVSFVLLLKFEIKITNDFFLFFYFFIFHCIVDFINDVFNFLFIKLHDYVKHYIKRETFL